MVYKNRAVNPLSCIINKLGLRYQKEAAPLPGPRWGKHTASLDHCLAPNDTHEQGRAVQITALGKQVLRTCWRFWFSLSAPNRHLGLSSTSMVLDGDIRIKGGLPKHTHIQRGRGSLVMKQLWRMSFFFRPTFFFFDSYFSVFNYMRDRYTARLISANFLEYVQHFTREM